LQCNNERDARRKRRTGRQNVLDLKAGWRARNRLANSSFQAAELIEDPPSAGTARKSNGITPNPQVIVKEKKCFFVFPQ
jgi:hypothetical protein